MEENLEPNNKATNEISTDAIKSNSEDVKNIYTDHYPDDLVNKELPIIIRGSLDNPDITIDLEYIIKKEIINPLKDKLLEKITDDLKEQIKLPF